MTHFFQPLGVHCRPGIVLGIGLDPGPALGVLMHCRKCRPSLNTNHTQYGMVREHVVGSREEARRKGKKDAREEHIIDGGRSWG